jgi:hypothetical protein
MYIEQAALIAITGLFVKIIDYLAKHFDKKGKDDEKELKEKVEKILKHVENSEMLHNKFDEDGNPVWYVPRSLIKGQEIQAHTLANMAFSQESLVKTLEKTTVILDNLVRVTTILEERSSRK